MPSLVILVTDSSALPQPDDRIMFGYTVNPNEPIIEKAWDNNGTRLLIVPIFDAPWGAFQCSHKREKFIYIGWTTATPPVANTNIHNAVDPTLWLQADAHPLHDMLH